MPQKRDYTLNYGGNVYGKWDMGPCPGESQHALVCVRPRS